MRVRKVSQLSPYKKNKPRIVFSPHHDLVELWILRILVALKGLNSKDLFEQQIHIDNVLPALGLDHPEIKSLGTQGLRKTLHNKFQAAEKKEIHLDGELKKNLMFLKQEIGINKTERELLTFALILHTNTALEWACDYLGELTSEGVINVLAEILNTPVGKIRHALSRKSSLFRSGILRLDRRGANEMSSKIDLIEGYHFLLESHSDVEEFLRSFFHPAGEATLKTGDFKHLKEELRLVTIYLGHAIRCSVSGVNILFYGPPGTGKTELAKTISHRIKAKSYEVAIVDIENEPLSERRRLEAYRMAQMVLEGQKKTLLLFDEVENLLAGGSNLFFLFGEHKKGIPTKASTNKQLEDNNVPAIWIANSIDDVDRAYIRRFNFVIHLDHPPRKIRATIIKKHLDGLPVSKSWIKSIAENKNISPAVFAKAAEVVRSLKHTKRKFIEADLELVIGNSLTAMGHHEMLTNNNEAMPYCLNALNPDTDLKLLLDGLANNPEVRLCLYGPSGTGKTQFGHYLAQKLGKQLLVQRASDILNAYVGETESNIALMFSNAKKEDAVLLLDEADSFLRDRQNALRSWEVTQVNELLTQMETFNGIFICSTNLMDSLDAASIRRFDLKIKFDYLNPKQSWLLFNQILQKQVANRDKRTWESKLSKFNNLTPGDFAIAVRRSRISNSPLTPQVLLECLTRESSFKSSSKNKRVGFAVN